LFGDDLIGVHVDFVERDDDAGMFAKWLHNFKPAVGPVNAGSSPWAGGSQSRHDTTENANFLYR
jgi:hypothetical protein